MLDLASHVTRHSRLACQIWLERGAGEPDRPHAGGRPQHAGALEASAEFFCGCRFSLPSLYRSRTGQAGASQCCRNSAGRHGCPAAGAGLRRGAHAARRARTRRIAAIERASGGRLGVALIDGSGRTLIAHRANERFAMCSTFKLPLARRCSPRPTDGARAADESFTRADLLPNSPYAEGGAARRGRAMRASARRRRSSTHSDNAAANLLLRRIGGPAEFTAAPAALRRQRHPARPLRDWRSTRMRAGDPRDTTSPAAMAGLMRALHPGRHAARRSARGHFRGWLTASAHRPAPPPRRPPRGLARRRQDRHLRQCGQRRRLLPDAGRQRIYPRRLSSTGRPAPPGARPRSPTWRGWRRGWRASRCGGAATVR